MNVKKCTKSGESSQDSIGMITTGTAGCLAPCPVKDTLPKKKVIDMNILFGSKSFDARHIVIDASRARVGDVISLGGVLLQVETIQKGCPMLEDLSHTFTSWVLTDETNVKHYSRALFGTLEVFRPTRKVA